MIASEGEEPIEADAEPIEADTELSEAVTPIETAAVSEHEGQRLVATHTVQHDYVTQSGKIVRETVTTDGTVTTVMDFIYDESGRPFALLYYANGAVEPETYYYLLNLQGDVVALMDSSGSIIAKYTYSAWGEVLAITDDPGEKITDETHIAYLNPLRYRGYYYDSETGFYYLQSRYYDPVQRRFINADAFASTGQGFIGTNMFAYCLNNPVMLIDSSGREPVTAVAGTAAGTLGTLLGAAVAVVGIFCIIVVGIEIGEAIGEAVTSNAATSYAEAKQGQVIGGDVRLWIEQQKDRIRGMLIASLAIAVVRNYKSPTEVHHIVASHACRAKPARDILKCLFKKGTEIEQNLVKLKTIVHRRLHTTPYYELVNMMVTTAYAMGSGDPEQQRANILIVLEELKRFLKELNELAPV